MVLLDRYLCSSNEGRNVEPDRSSICIQSGIGENLFRLDSGFDKTDKTNSIKKRSLSISTYATASRKAISRQSLWVRLKI